MIEFFYAANIFLLGCSLLSLILSGLQKQFSLGIILILIFLPIFAAEYLFVASSLDEKTLLLLFLSELAMALLWLSMILNVKRAGGIGGNYSKFRAISEVAGIVAVALVGVVYIGGSQTLQFQDNYFFFKVYDPLFFSLLFILLILLYGGWQLELFYRKLNNIQRWEYKFFIIGSYLVSGAVIWQASYRLTYLRIQPKHFLLLSILMLLGWAMMTYAVFHHRLLNRKIFVSRKIIYSFVVPSFLATYLLGFGVVTFVMRSLGYNMAYVINWLLIVVGCVLTMILILSPKLRRKAHFFISTHFYNNKYEYRDEWLALSEHLQGARTEIDVIKAMQTVLMECLYTSTICIWLGDEWKGFHLVAQPSSMKGNGDYHYLSARNSLVEHVKPRSHFYIEKVKLERAVEVMLDSDDNFLTPLGLKLLVPLTIGQQLVGLVAVGEEFTGGEYGHDDFDLLSALSSQTASALLAIRMGEELSNAREQQAWMRLSAFVLHDIKNAATMLSLLQNNAPQNIHKPEFQEDMLELIGDALGRMNRVEKQLSTLDRNMEPTFERVELHEYLTHCRKKLETKLVGLTTGLSGDTDIAVSIDPDLFSSVIENLFINSYEATGEKSEIALDLTKDSKAHAAILTITDNGPGIDDSLLPEGLFEPFKTSKDGGSGIGLWQAKQVMNNLGGTIEAANTENGALFTLLIPLHER